MIEKYKETTFRVKVIWVGYTTKKLGSSYHLTDIGMNKRGCNVEKSHETTFRITVSCVENTGWFHRKD